MAIRTCPWCDSSTTERLGEAGSLLMTEPWYCLDCSSAFEVIRKRGGEAATADEPTDTVDGSPLSPRPGDDQAGSSR